MWKLISRDIIMVIWFVHIRSLFCIRYFLTICCLLCKPEPGQNPRCPSELPSFCGCLYYAVLIDSRSVSGTQVTWWCIMAKRWSVEEGAFLFKVLSSPWLQGQDTPNEGRWNWKNFRSSLAVIVMLCGTIRYVILTFSHPQHSRHCNVWGTCCKLTLW